MLHVGQVNVRYRPWRHQRYRMPGPVPEPGGFYCVVLAPTEDPWAAGLPEKAALPGDDAPAPHRPSCPAVQKRAAADRGHGHGMTLLSGLCRQLYQETAMLPFMLNTWSFQNRAVMDRFVLKERRLSQSKLGAPSRLESGKSDSAPAGDGCRPLLTRCSAVQRRSIHTIFMQGEISTTMEKFFGGLHFIHGVDGRILQYTYPDIKTRHCGRWKLLVRTWC